MLVRTTVRLEESLKKSAEKRALEENTSLQEIFQRALRAYLKKEAQKQAKIIFKTLKLGKSLDNLTREDFYPDPEL